MSIETKVHASAVCCWCRGSLVWVAQGERSSEWVPEGHWWCSSPGCRTKQLERAVAQQVTAAGGKGWRWEYLFVPLPKQAEFLGVMAPYKLYGGAAGPGKSHAMRWGLYRLAQVIPNFRALLLRESFEELEQTHFADMEVEQDQVGGRFIKGDHLMMFDRNKSRIIGGHLQDAKAVRRYLSTNYDVIACDEGSQYPPKALLELSTRARTSKSAARPYVGDGQFWVGTNPGGPGAAVLKDFFITHQPNFEEHPYLQASYSPAEWVYLPALLEDNPYSAESYERKLAVLSKWRYEQLRFGDWDATEGQFFEMSARTHARTVSVPRPVEGVVEAVDWGFTSPGTVAWYVPVGDQHWYVIDEWKFRGMTAEEVAAGIVERRKVLGVGSVAYTVTDPSMHNKTGHGHGESFAETFARFGVPCRRGDNDRRMGWPRLAAWYREANGVPWLTYDPGCTYSLRSIPGLLSDKHDPEDVDSSLDDHAADRDRYFVMSRPPLHSPSPTVAPVVPNSWGWWKRYHRTKQEQPRWQ